MTTENPTFDFTQSQFYKDGKLYEQWGRMLQDPDTTLQDISDFAFENGLRSEITLRTVEESNEVVQQYFDNMFGNPLDMLDSALEVIVEEEPTDEGESHNEDID